MNPVNQMGLGLFSLLACVCLREVLIEVGRSLKILMTIEKALIE